MLSLFRVSRKNGKADKMLINHPVKELQGLQDRSRTSRTGPGPPGASPGRPGAAPEPLLEGV